MAARPSWTFRFRACQRCGGDAYLDPTDEPEWRCLQCARPVAEQRTARLVTAPVTLRAA